jgi:soluble lytic murein transglycosylase
MVMISSKQGSIAMRVLSRILFFGLVIGVLQPLTGAATPHDPLAGQRALFLESRDALNRGQRDRFRQLAVRIPDYPLQPYLQYWELQRYLSVQTGDSITAFLEAYPDTSLSQRLRTSWLQHLARQKDWTRFLAFYEEPQGVELQCQALRAQLGDDSQREALLDHAEQLWLVGQSQPGACDPVFDVLYASSRMTSTLIWERIRLAMDTGRLELATFLAKKLSAEDRGWVRHWAEMHRRPAQTLADPALPTEGPMAREIIHHGLIRLARHDPDQAFARWEELRDQQGFEPGPAAVALRRMALSAAYAHHPRALEWLSGVPAEAADDAVQQWRIRSALPGEDWLAVLDAYQSLSATEREKTEWRYWYARALHARGDEPRAMQEFTALALERDYHGFLSADRLDWQYAMNHEAIAASPEELEELERHPGVLRARELYRAGLITDARREWYALTRQMPQRQLELAARLAHQWDWHDRAIITTAHAAHYSDLDLRFPLLYKKEVMSTARQQQLDPALIFGVIRQESAFMRDARSPAGALGLMQLMPATGRMTAKQERVQLPSIQSLMQSDKNILLGSAYLRRMLDEFDGNPALATAAYNAGPHRVKRWRPAAEQSADVWVDRIPFNETRNYVRNVLAYSAIFEYRLERPVTRLRERLPDIKQAQP